MTNAPLNGGGKSAQADSARIVVCGRREDPFVRVPKTLINDDRLSWKAKGILIYLIGKPADWKVRVRDLMNQGTDGRDSVRAGLMELRQFGYCELVCLKDGGKVKEWVWKVSDSPIFPPETDFPHLENPSLTKKDSNQERPSKGSKETAKQALPHVVSFSGPKKSKAQQLLAVRWRRKTIPDEESFWEWCDQNDWVLGEYRSDIYETLVRQKFHHWNERLKRWTPIRDLRAYLAALNDCISPQR